MSALRIWLAGRSPRERRLILAMLALAVVTIVWGLLIRPVRDGLSSSRERYADAVVRLGEAENGLRAVKAIQRRQVRALDRPLADAIRDRADAAGFALAALEPDGGDRVRIAVASARPGALMAWIAGLEREGVLVDELAITPGAAGTVTARMTLKARSG